MIGTTRVWQWATVVVVTLIVGVITMGAVYLSTSVNDLRADLATTQDEVAASTSNAQELYDQLTAEGIKPEAEKPAEVNPPPPREPRQGDKGDDGRDARPLTAIERAADIAAYCALVSCIGRDGAASIVAGPMGPASTVPGETGGSGQDGKDGGDGTDGINGVNGADGRGITSITCYADAELATYLRVTLTDTSTTDIPAPCTPPAPIPPIS